MIVLERNKLLVVDDIDINRVVLSELFSDRFEILEAANGIAAISVIEKYADQIAVVLLDIIMPVMDGFGVLRRMNEIDLIKKIPVVLITGENADEKALTGYTLGVSDLIYKPFNSDVVVRRVNNVIDLYSYKNHLEQKLEEQKEELYRQEQRIKQSNLFLIDALSTTVEFRNFESGDHIKRMRGLVMLVLTEARKYYPLTNEEIESISIASALHDVGKIAIPDSVLLKPGPLTDEEFEIMKTHTVRGCEILENLDYFEDREYYKYCYEICRYHHERWDGRGYPDKLKEDEIPIWAQATSLADVYDALTSKRVYKGAYTHEEAVRMILDGKCGTFNPRLIECFKKIEPELKSKAEEQKSLSPAPR
jgi:putative two-component system response regulator